MSVRFSGVLVFDATLSVPFGKKKSENHHQYEEKVEEEEDDELERLDNLFYYMGDFGRYQKFIFLIMLPFGFIYAFIYHVHLFITAIPSPYWCRVPELANLSMAQRRNLTAPGAAEGKKWDKCHMYNVNWEEKLQSGEALIPPDPNTPVVTCPHGWEYELIGIPYHTVATERDWVCQDAYYVPKAHSMFFIGSFAGCLFFGFMADHFGRLPALIGANMVGFLGGIAGLFTRGFWDYALTRFLVGMSYDEFTMMYVLMIESVGPWERTYVANMSLALSYCAGCIVMPFLALWFANWRLLLLMTTLPMLIVLLLPFTMPESARWLLTKGHTHDAVREFQRFEEKNGTKIPNELLAEYLGFYVETKPHDTFMTLLRSAPLRNTIFMMVFIFMVCALNSEALIHMSEQLGMDFFLTFALIAMVELPSILLLVVLLDRWGRRKLTAGPLAISGSLLFVALFVPKGIPLTTIGIISRFFITMAYRTTILWVAEVLPTSIRVLGTALLHTSGFIATAGCPFFVFSARLYLLPPLGAASLVACILALVLPETRGRHLPQSVADGEYVVKENSPCRFKKQGRRKPRIPRK